MSEAGLDANTSFGTLILEQDGTSVLRRMDEPRPGDVVVLSDVKLKGKKGLHSYTQAAGSVEIPVFAICSEFEAKKMKVKVWQVEQGVSGDLRVERLLADPTLLLTLDLSSIAHGHCLLSAR